jgi:predicted  nucleic acid-binding Zn-ribbon protein
MADRGPDYSVERRRLLLTKAEHAQTIAKGRSRIEEIQRQKEINAMRADVANAELDSEITKLEENERSLDKSIAEIESKLESMVVVKSSD